MMVRWFLRLVPVLLLGLLIACNGGDDPPQDETPSGPTSVTFWHSMPIPAGGSLEAIAEKFNASQTDYVIELIFQGGYSDSLNKLITSSNSDNIPAVIQLSDASTQIMIDSGAITPIQSFIDEEGYDLSDFEPKALVYYTIGDVLYSMPFNMSGPILYYDRLAFQEAGLDPDDPPTTLEEVREYSEQLLQFRDDGSVSRYGISLQTNAWFFEQMLAIGGELYVDGENGREERATHALFDSATGVEIITWWDDMVDDGYAYNAGGDAIDAMLKLASGEAAMTIGSTAALRAAIAAIALIGRDPFQYDTAPMPGPEGNGGIALGGASLWILNGRPEAEQRGAWEFIKFAASPAQQGQWHSDTGYFPNRISAYDEPPAMRAREEFPQFLTAVEQLRASPATAATSGVLLGPLNTVRARLVEAFDQVLAGGGDPAQELAAAAEEATEIIEAYNRTAP
jgi:sn-glycerol 3-phosphate transport system substrate-binding protein